MMERSPAVSVDLVYFKGSGQETGENSRQREGTWLRMFVGNLEFSLDAGCLHRLEVSLQALLGDVELCDYSSKFGEIG
jgi:hypothetical protein